MYDINAIAQFDRRSVTSIKQVERRIQQDGYAAGHILRDVHIHRVLMPWTGTKRWDGSAESFTFAEFETDQGLVGISEGASSELAELKKEVLGKNPFDPSIRAAMGLALLGLCRQIGRQTIGALSA